MVGRGHNKKRYTLPCLLQGKTLLDDLGRHYNIHRILEGQDGKGV